MELSIQTRLAAVGRDHLVWSNEGYGNLPKQIDKVEKELHMPQMASITSLSCDQCNALEK